MRASRTFKKLSRPTTSTLLKPYKNDRQIMPVVAMTNVEVARHKAPGLRGCAFATDMVVRNEGVRVRVSA